MEFNQFYLIQNGHLPMDSVKRQRNDIIPMDYRRYDLYGDHHFMFNI